MTANLMTIPAYLTDRRSFVNWRYEERDGRKTKVPYNAATGRRASSTDPATWNDFALCKLAYEEGQENYDGLGYVVSPSDPVCGIDLDHCIDEDGNLSAEAADIVALMNSYTEITPSGRGLRIFVRGTLPPGGRKRGNIEAYDRGRFLTLTGNVFSGAEVAERDFELIEFHKKYLGGCPPIEKDETPRRARAVSELKIDDQAALTRAFAAKNGARIGQLWRGDYIGAGYTSRSEADSALCFHLAFWLDADPERVDRIFRDSGLYRDKWDEKHYGDGRTYGNETVARACQRVTETYTHTVALNIGNIVNIVNGVTNPNTDSSSSIKEEEVRTKPLLGIVAGVDNVDNVANTPNEGAWEAIVPLGAYDLPPFPVAVLPAWLADFVTATAEQTQTPPDMAGILALSACASAVAKKFEIQPKTGWREPLNLYAAVVLSPGNRKSAVCAAVTRPLEEYERSERDRLEPEMAQAQAEKRVMEARLKDLERKAASAKDKIDYEIAMEEVRDAATTVAATAEQGEFRLFTEDCTPERLTGLLADNGGRMAILSAEGDTFDIISGRYSDKANLGVYLKSHSGETLIVDRIGRKGERVERPALTIGMAIQPDVIRGLLGKSQLRGRGLLGRFLYSLPVDRLGFRDTAPEAIPLETAEAYHAGVHYLLSLTPMSPDVPYVLGFSSAARSAFSGFEEVIEPQLRPGAEMGDMTDWGGKVVGAVARLAAILHLAGHAHTGLPMTYEIGVADVIGAIHLGFYLMQHARAAFSEMGADADLDNARQILAWVQRKNLTDFTQRDAYRALARRFKRPEDMAPALALLCGRNFLREVTVQSAGTKPRSAGFEVNPIVFGMELYR